MQNNINVVWTCVAAFMVFFMQAGFAMVEAGFTRAKNAVNILMKNLMDFSIGTIAFFVVGFTLMFGASKGVFGWDGFGVPSLSESGSVLASIPNTTVNKNTVYVDTPYIPRMNCFLQVQGTH